MNIQAIVYESNTGFTAQYAALLSQETGIPAYPLSNAKDLPQAAAVLFMGWLCAGKIKGYQKASKRFSVLAVCAVGMASPCEKVLADVVTQNALSQVPCFYLQGGFDLAKLRGPYRMMMGVMKKTVGKSLQQKPNRTQEEQTMLDLLQHGGSFVKREALSPVLAWLS